MKEINRIFFKILNIQYVTMTEEAVTVLWLRPKLHTTALDSMLKKTGHRCTT